MIHVVLLLIMTLMGSVASLFLKKASGSQGLLALLKAPSLYLGGLLYVGSAVLNIILLRHLAYSLVLPLTSLTYVWTLFLSSRVFGEKITVKKLLGVALVALGAILISI